MDKPNVTLGSKYPASHISLILHHDAIIGLIWDIMMLKVIHLDWISAREFLNMNIIGVFNISLLIKDLFHQIWFQGFGGSNGIQSNLFRFHLVVSFSWLTFCFVSFLQDFDPLEDIAVLLCNCVGIEGGNSVGRACNVAYWFGDSFP